jgi:cell division septation protein DedD
MEEPLKARLIGAAVLVALAVLLIPELLSGLKAVEPVAEEGTGARGTRTFTIELGTGAGQSARAGTTPAPAAASAPQAAPKPSAEAPPAGPEVEPEGELQAGPAASLPEPEPAVVAPAPKVEPPAASAPAAAPAASAQAAPAPPATGRGWLIQVGAFGSADTARSLVKTLTAAGYPAHVSPLTRGGKTLHRVRVGPEDERASAEKLAERLKARGLPATIVQNE